MKLTPTELLILDSLSLFGKTIDTVLDPLQYDAKPHQTKPTVILHPTLNTILSLWNNGLIAWMDDNDLATVYAPELGSESDVRNLSLGLTKDGAQAWESHFMPEWSLFFSETWSDTTSSKEKEGNGILEIEAFSLTRIRQILFLGEYYWGVNFSLADAEFRELPSYRPVYWKQMDDGWCCRVPFDNSGRKMEHIIKCMRIWTRRGFNPHLCLEPIC